MKVLGVIPARYASTRFPGKPLAMIGEMSMIRRVYKQAVSCLALTEVLVATDDSRIAKHVAEFGGEVMMTSQSHQSGTERCSEVYAALEKSGRGFDVLVNIQGDEPFIQAGQIEQVIGCFGIPGTMIASLKKEISREEELNNPNVVKVLTDVSGKALYFSRAAIPYVRDKFGDTGFPGRHHFYKHIGIYGYRPDVLGRIVKLPPSELETAESLEQLRWLENGYEILLKETSFESIAIDSPSDLLKLTNRG